MTPDRYSASRVFRAFVNARFWRELMRRITTPFLCTLVLATSVLLPARSQEVSRPSLWGKLSPGPYAVGFRAVYAFDRARTWRVTRAYEKGFSPDPDGRPIRVSVWYPATISPGAKRMRYEDYVTLPAPKEIGRAHV